MGNNAQEFDKFVLDTIKQYSNDSVYFKDLDSKFLWNSKTHAMNAGASSPDEMVGKSDFDYYPEEFALATREAELEIIRTGVPVINKCEDLSLDEDNPKYILASKYPLYGNNNEIVGTWGISKNITEQKKIEKELEKAYKRQQQLARVDDMSGLYNRRYFYESLERMISIYSNMNTERTFAVIAIDIDDLKYINDSYGQPKGDDIVRHVASTLAFTVGKSDTCYRIGGDEFMVVLPGVDKLSAISMAKKITEKVSESPVNMDIDKFERVTVSSGVALWEKDMDMSKLISSADRKLYKSKRNGKNQVSV